MTLAKTQLRSEQQIEQTLWWSMCRISHNSKKIDVHILHLKCIVPVKFRLERLCSITWKHMYIHILTRIHVSKYTHVYHINKRSRLMYILSMYLQQKPNGYGEQPNIYLSFLGFIIQKIFRRMRINTMMQNVPFYWEVRAVQRKM